MPVTSAVTAPYNGTSNQTQIAKTNYIIPHAELSMLSNTRTSTVTLSTPRHQLASPFLLFPYPYLIPYKFTYLASELTTGRNRSQRPMTN